jgi:hypothetical protein
VDPQNSRTALEDRFKNKLCSYRIAACEVVLLETVNRISDGLGVVYSKYHLEHRTVTVAGHAHGRGDFGRHGCSIT